MTSRHCIDWDANAVIFDRPLPPLPAPGEGIYGMTFGYFVDTQDRQLSVATRRVAYSTVKGVDVAVVELDATAGQLTAAGYRPLEISTEAAEPGEPVAVVGAPSFGVAGPKFLRLGSCTVGKRVNLIEFIWHWWDFYPSDCPDIRGGSSGSPMISGRSGKVVAVVSTGTEEAYARGGLRPSIQRCRAMFGRGTDAELSVESINPRRVPKRASGLSYGHVRWQQRSPNRFNQPSYCLDSPFKVSPRF